MGGWLHPRQVLRIGLQGPHARFNRDHPGPDRQADVLVVVHRAAVAFDFENGNAAVEVVIPTVAPIVFTDVSPSGGDATLVLRVTTMTTNSWFESAFGCCSKKKRE